MRGTECTSPQRCGWNFRGKYLLRKCIFFSFKNKIFSELSCALFVGLASASHGSSNYVAKFIGTYLRGVTVSMSESDPNPDTGAKRLKVKTTYNFRRNMAGYGNGCTQWDIDRNRKSGVFGPADYVSNGS